MMGPTFTTSGGGHGMRGAHSAGGGRRGNDSYIKAASDDRGKLLDTQIKSICHGCREIVGN
jgi:hypothetical protein